MRHEHNAKAQMHSNPLKYVWAFAYVSKIEANTMPNVTGPNPEEPWERIWAFRLGGRKPMKFRPIIAAICTAFVISMAGAASAHDGEAQTVTKNFDASISNIPGKSLVALEVDYAPGAASPSHTHAKSAFIYAYVISGAIESKVNDGETRIYRAGEAARDLRPRHQ
jgi:hypothetical protein